VRETLELEMELEKCPCPEFCGVVGVRETPLAAGLILGKTVPGNSQTKMDYRPRQTNGVLMIYYSSRIAHVLRDSASSRGLFQVATTEFETN
jgi:hypothetical protein